MNVLVTGGAGFIGSHLVLKLLDKGHDVIVVDNLNDYYDVSLKEKRLSLFIDRVKFYKVDITDNTALKIVFNENKIDKICHLAAQAGVRYSLENPFIYADTNYCGTVNIFEFAKQFEVKHVVFASTSSVYGLNKTPFTEDMKVDTPISIYSASKRACELLAHTYNYLFGLSVTCLRFFTVYGPFGRPDMALFKFTKNILADESIDVYNKGDMKRDFTYVSDIVDGFLKCFGRSGYEIFNLGAGKTTALMDYIKTLEKCLGKKAKMNLLPMQPGDVKETSADITKASKELGFKPKIDVTTGVSNFVDWYNKYY
jgi:UDP-glucuronate 4-epimerase